MINLSSLSSNTQQAYARAIHDQAHQAGLQGAVVRDFAGVNRFDVQSPFVQAVRHSVNQAIGAQKIAENASYQAIRGEASLTDVIPAILQAEASLNTVVAIRDRAVSAYQEILRMPV